MSARNWSDSGPLFRRQPSRISYQLNETKLDIWADAAETRDFIGTGGRT